MHEILVHASRSPAIESEIREHFLVRRGSGIPPQPFSSPHLAALAHTGPTKTDPDAEAALLFTRAAASGLRSKGCSA